MPALVHPPADAAPASGRLDVGRYHDEGILAIHKLFEPALVADLLDAWRRIKPDVHTQANGFVRQDRFLYGNLPEPIASLYKHPALVTIARAIFGEDVALYMNRILVKDEKWNGPVAIHQDMVYFHGGLEKVAVFVPLGEMSDRSGGLKFVVGSHKYGNLGLRGTIQLKEFPPMDIASPTLMPGDVCLMNFLTWHYSEAAQQPIDRPVLQIAYQPASDGSRYLVPEPTLVCGQWRTKHFVKHNHGVVPDGQPAPKK